MKPSKAMAVEVESTFPVIEDIEMTIDPNAMAHLMHLLTNLYGDEEMAPIREYSTNAWDAHIEAGTTDIPIEVTTPTPLSPNLVIKDYGTGMDAMDIRDIYSRYGRTTKDTSNEQNGRMGIGGKSALAYTSQFTVVGIKNGTRTTVVVSRNVDGGGSMQIIGMVETDEPNGVEVIIPAKPHNRMREKAENFFRFWKKGTVLLNGEDPHASLRKISDHIYEFEDADTIDQDYVIMGNVAYPVEYEHQFSYGGGYVAFVSMEEGERVYNAPDREGLIYNSETKHALAMLTEEFNNYIVKHVQSQIDAQETNYAALAKRNEAVDRYGLSEDFTFKGAVIPNMDNTDVYDGNFIKWQIGASRNSVSGYRGTKIRLANLNNAKIIIVNYRSEVGVSGSHKKRIKEYIKEHFGEYYYYAYGYFFHKGVKELPDFTWVDRRKIIDWKTILEETRDPREYSGGYSRGGTGSDAYEYYDKDGLKVGMPPSDAVVYYYSPAEHYYDSAIASYVLSKEPKAVFICANKNRHGKLLRLFPKAEPYQPWEWRNEYAKAEFDKIPQADIDAIMLYTGYRSMLSYRDEDRNVRTAVLNNASEILDKGLVAVYETMHEGKRIMDKWACTYAPNDSRWHKFSFSKEKPDFDFDKYPLRDWNKPKDTIEYINALYKCRNEEKDES